MLLAVFVRGDFCYRCVGGDNFDSDPGELLYGHVQRQQHGKRHDRSVFFDLRVFRTCTACQQ